MIYPIMIPIVLIKISTTSKIPRWIRSCNISIEVISNKDISSAELILNQLSQYPIGMNKIKFKVTWDRFVVSKLKGLRRFKLMLLSW